MSEDRIEALKQLLEQEPHDTMLLFGLGNELFGLGQYTDAIPYFEEAVRVASEPAVFLGLMPVRNAAATQ